MLEDTLFTSAASQQIAGRKYATLLSFTIQTALVGLLIITPLLYTQALPERRAVMLLRAPVAAPAPPRNAVAEVPLARETEIFNGKIQTPRSVPRHIAILAEQEPQISPATGFEVPVTAVSATSADALLTDIANSALLPVVKPAVPKSIKVSAGIVAGLLTHEVKPLYPRIAQQAGVHGSVILNARISKEGQIQNLQVSSGHPLLVPAAIDAVRQWRYDPYLLNGEPVEVETQVTVNFILAGR